MNASPSQGQALLCASEMRMFFLTILQNNLLLFVSEEKVLTRRRLMVYGEKKTLGKLALPSTISQFNHVKDINKGLLLLFEHLYQFPTVSFPLLIKKKCNLGLPDANHYYQPYNSNKFSFCFFVKFPRGKVNSRDNRGVRNKGRGLQTTYYKQRTESQNSTMTVDWQTRWPDKRHMLDCYAKERRYQNKTIQRCWQSSS